LGLAAVGLVLLIAGGGVLFAKAGKSMTETVAQTPTVPQGEESRETPTKETPKAAVSKKPVVTARKTHNEITPSAAIAPTATVILDVRPRGEIILDGKKAGVSPPLNRLSVSAGVKHKIEIHGAGVPHYWTLELKPGEKKDIRADFRRPNY
jgi:hypothetical protein